MSQQEHLNAIMSNRGSPKPPAASRNAFKPLYHHLPEFRTNGKEREVFHRLDSKNILADKERIKVPSHWKSNPDLIRTQTKLFRHRRDERIPDPSFDLNGDGTVSAHEYAIAKMFDFDFDGKLNAEEKAHCLQKLKEGFEDNLYWDADQGDMRIIQRDGKILLPDAEFGFINADEEGVMLGKTFPLLQHQRLEDRKSMNNKVFESFLKKEQEKKAIIEKMCEIKPVKRAVTNKVTLTDVKENRKNQHRAKAGLSPQPHDEKLLRKDPSMEYLRSPRVHTYQELKQKRVKDKCIDYKFKFDKKANPDEVWTFDSRIVSLDTDTIRTPDVHKLPWKHKKKEIKSLSPVQSPKTYVKQQVKDGVADKINKLVVFPGYKEKGEFIPYETANSIKYKWSTIEDRFRCGFKNRMYDEYPNYHPLSTDYLPLYSSFSKDHKLNVPELPGKKMQAESEVREDSGILTRRSPALDTLYKRKDNMFNRVSPDRSLLKISKSTYELNSSGKGQPKNLKDEFATEGSKTMSLLKKCALQGIRASSFKRIEPQSS